MKTDATWEDLKTQLSLRFAAVKYRDHALTLLQKCKQAKGESVPLFAERVHQMAREAFPEAAEFASAPVQRQIVFIFASGLLSDAINFRILRRKPNRFLYKMSAYTRQPNADMKDAFR